MHMHMIYNNLIELILSLSTDGRRYEEIQYQTYHAS